MKHRVGLATLAALLPLLVVALTPLKISASSCEYDTDVGAVDMMLPELPEADSHTIWIRLQSQSTSVKVLAEINQNNCLEVGSGSVTPNQWTWETYRQNGAVRPIKFPKSEGNTLRLIGIEPGVKVDRVLITRSNCIPLELGDNCVDSAEAVTLGSGSGITNLPPPSNDEVSGKITLSATPGIYSSQLKSLTYSEGTQTLQTFTTNEPFDTTLISDSKHTIVITTTLENGVVIKEQTVIDVDNNENALSLISRWIRLHMGSIITIGKILGAFLAMMILFSLMRKALLSYRRRKFHGL